jgi:stress response protein SCP2
MDSLSKGANIPVTARSLRVRVSWGSRAGTPEVDLMALLLTESGTVRSDDDLVFYNQPSHRSGAVRSAGKEAAGPVTTDALNVDLAQVEPDIDRILIGASADGGSFGAVPELVLELAESATGTGLAEFRVPDASTETAFVFGEFYRRAGGWKFRAVGQGYATGLAGLATDYGISVDEPPAAPRPASTNPPARPSAQPARSGKVNLDKGRVSLRKNERVSLVKTGAPPLTKVRMGLGWDPAKAGKDVDLDASALAFDQANKKIEIVWFTHLSEFQGALVHTGDNLTGEGEGDDEQILIDLAALPSRVHSLVFTINSFRGHKFTEISAAFCRLVDVGTGAELVRFDLSESEPRTGVIMAVISREPAGSWEMRAVGEFHEAKTARAMVEPATKWLRDHG